MADDLFSHTVPPSPPLTDIDRLTTLRLIRSRRVGAMTFHRLVQEHGSVAEALDALPDIARAAGVKAYSPCPASAAERELSAGKKAGARLICYGEPDYPTPLYNLPDAPPVLWLRGQADLLTRPMIALVGARNASSLGTRMARKLAGELGEAGFVVTSGLARGIDAAAHLAALPHGTVAVLAGGVDVVYPMENLTLMDQIADEGAILSEQPVGMQPLARHFPMRNRIISGLSRAVVVVEAALKSGSLITARNALDQGREVMAVPGHPIDARASGCNTLIRDGAVLVRTTNDILSTLDDPPAPQRSVARMPLPKPAPRATEPETVGDGSQILPLLGPTPIAVDQLIRDCALPADQVMPILTLLELEGRIERRAGGLISRRDP